MEIVISRFPHIAEQTFAHLDTNALKNFREVAKSPQKFIDAKNLSWIRICNIPTTLHHGESYLHLAAKSGQLNIIENILENEQFNKEVNAKDLRCGWTAFHLACKHGHSKIVNTFVEKSTGLKIDLNAKDEDGWTAFHWACYDGQLEIAKIFMKKSAEFNIDLNGIDTFHGKTAFHWACDSISR